MSHPAKALNGVRAGNICDRCNKGLRTGDLVRAYATDYPDNGWTLRRVWCDDCGDSSIEIETKDADEVIIEGVFWQYQILSVEVRDRSRPEEVDRCE